MDGFGGGGEGGICQLSGDAFIEAALHDRLQNDPLRVIVTGSAWESTLHKGEGPGQGLLMQQYDTWMNHPVQNIIKGLQTLINLTGECPKSKQMAIVKGV